MSKKIFSLPIVLLFLPLVLVLIGGCVAPTQAWLDAKVDRLCAKDGGVKIYEKAYLPSQEYQNIVRTHFTSAKQIREVLGNDYIVKFNFVYLYGSNKPERKGANLIRSSYQLFRAAEGKLLAENTDYSRTGGDPAWILWSGHPSMYDCPSPPASLDDMIHQVFIEIPEENANDF